MRGTRLPTLALLLLTFSLAAASLHADVFSLWPFSRKGGSAASPYALDEALSPNKLWNEPVVINGVKLSLGLSLVRENLTDCLAKLRKLYPKAVFKSNPTSALVSVKLSSKTIRRIYIIQIGGSAYPTIQFAMDIPANMPQNFDWPSALPLPASATPITYMYLQNREAYYGIFSVPYEPVHGVTELVGILSSSGWSPVTNESTSGLSGKGDVFIRKNPPAIMLLNFGKQNDSGIAQGSIYTRPIK